LTDERPMAQLARERYFSEFDHTVRRVLLSGLLRFREPGQEWLQFLSDGLSRELSPANRFLLRYAEICETKSAATDSSIEDLVSSFVGCDDRSEEALQRFGIALHALTAERELSALVNALRCAGGWELCCFLSERLLRLVFKDERTGWQNLSYTRIQPDGSAPGAYLKKVLERPLRRKPGASGLTVASYWGLEGARPKIPERLTRRQRIALGALVENADVWTYRTNLWELFGLPDNRAAMKAFLATH